MVIKRLPPSDYNPAGSSPDRRPSRFARRQCDIAPDDERFLMIDQSGKSEGRINVVLNWFEELKQRVPTGR